jgi:hypothetical protein
MYNDVASYSRWDNFYIKCKGNRMTVADGFLIFWMVIVPIMMAAMAYGDRKPS